MVAGGGRVIRAIGGLAMVALLLGGEAYALLWIADTLPWGSWRRFAATYVALLAFCCGIWFIAFTAGVAPY